MTFHLNRYAVLLERFDKNTQTTDVAEFRFFARFSESDLQKLDHPSDHHLAWLGREWHRDDNRTALALMLSSISRFLKGQPIRFDDDPDTTLLFRHAWHVKHVANEST